MELKPNGEDAIISRTSGVSPERDWDMVYRATRYIVETCPITKYNGKISRRATGNAVEWLTDLEIRV